MSGMEEELKEFLRRRSVQNEIIDRMEKEKIGLDEVNGMTEDILARYLPAFGDRLALINFAKTKLVESKDKRKKRSLFQKLRHKMKLRSYESDSEDEITSSKKKVRDDLDGNKHAMKKTRLIDMGWIHNGKQVKQKQGGGTRQLTVDKTCNKNSLIQIGVDLFFPGGESKKGNAAEMIFSILDFKEVELPEHITVGDVYQIAKIGRARFYLSSAPIIKTSETKEIHTPAENQSSLQSKNPSPSSSSCSLRVSMSVLQNTSDCLLPQPVSSSFQPCPCSSLEYNASLYNILPIYSQVINSEPSYLYPNQLSVPSFLSSPIPFSSENASIEQPEPVTGFNVTEPPSTESEPVSQLLENTAFQQPDSVTAYNEAATEQTVVAQRISLLLENTEQVEPTAVSSNEQALMTEEPFNMLRTHDDRIQQTATATTALSSPLSINTYTNVVSASPVTNFVPNIEEIVSSASVEDSIDGPLRLNIHRVNVKEELIGVFKDPAIMKRHIKFSFINEQGIDNLGVSRDVYSSFWFELFTSNAEGENARVPALSPKWQAEEWMAIGRILLKGFIDANFYPIQFAIAFTVAIIHGENAVTPKVLMDSFFQYLNRTDRDLVELAIDGNIDSADQDDLLDLLERFGSKSIPNTEGLKPLFLQIAHKELIQKPKYALDKISSESREHLSLFFPDTSSIEQMYNAKVPTVKKVLKLVTATPENHEEAEVLKYFQLYVKAQESPASLKKLLRFLTGSDVISVDKITLTFTHIEGLARRPVAHTCGPVLELPSTYQSYPELRSDFDNILNSQECMEMTIA